MRGGKPNTIPTLETVDTTWQAREFTDDCLNRETWGSNTCGSISCPRLIRGQRHMQNLNIKYKQACIWNSPSCFGWLRKFKGLYGNFTEIIKDFDLIYQAPDVLLYEEYENVNFRKLAIYLFVLKILIKSVSYVYMAGCRKFTLQLWNFQ